MPNLTLGDILLQPICKEEGEQVLRKGKVDRGHQKVVVDLTA